MTRYNRAGGVFDIIRSLRKTREEFGQAYEDVAAVVSKNTEMGSDNMSKSKRHYIADEELGGVEREYTEADQKAGVGDIVTTKFGVSDGWFTEDGRTGYKVNTQISDGVIGITDNYGDPHFLSEDTYKTLSPTDIIRHNGERYRLSEKDMPEVGDKVLVINSSECPGAAGNVGTVLSFPHRPVIHSFTVDIPSHVYDDYSYIDEGFDEYTVLELVIDRQADDTPDLIDLVIRLTRKVAELEKTANIADYKAGQALTTSELHATHIETLSSDVISLSKRRYCR